MSHRISTLRAALPAVALALVFAHGGCTQQGSAANMPKHQTRLHLTVRDAATKQPMAALVNFHTAAGQGVTFGNFADLPGWAQGASAMDLAKPNDGVFAFRHGLALWRGEGVFLVGKPWSHRDVQGSAQISSQLSPGVYSVMISHGVEYDAVTLQVDLGAGKGEVAFVVDLKRTVDSAGYLSADLHTHQAPDSPDAYTSAANQLKVAAANGLEIMVASNHDTLADLGSVAAGLWPKGAPVATVVGEEKSGTNSHWGVFPLPHDASKPGKGAPATRVWPLPEFFADLRAIPGRPILVSNHPRLNYQSYMDEGFCGAWAKKDFAAPPPCPQDYDATEVLNGWQTCGTRVRDATATWLALATYGFVSAAVGGSDAHFVSAMVPGYPRTWINVADDNLARFSPSVMVAAIRARHTVASNGPLVRIRSGAFAEGDFMPNAPENLPISIRVQSANWVPVDTARLLVNGVVTKTWTIPRDGAAVDFKIDEVIALSPSDAFITVETDSQQPLPPLIVGEYNTILQYGLAKCAPRTGEAPGLPAYAVTSPLFVDRDGDGMFRGHMPGALPARKL